MKEADDSALSELLRRSSHYTSGSSRKKGLIPPPDFVQSTPGGHRGFRTQHHLRPARSFNYRTIRQNNGRQSNAISAFHSFHTLPTRSTPGLSVGLPGRQPDGVA